jgi:hypothetical protein
VAKSNSLLTDIKKEIFNMKNLKSKWMARALICLIGLYSISGTAKADTTGKTVVNGTISATILNISVPTALVFTVDPNNTGTKYIASMADIKNDSNAPITVAIGAGSANFAQSADSNWKPADYLPTAFNWESLGKIESENALALGVKIKDTSEWRQVTRSETLWVLEQNKMATDVVFGDLDPHSTASVTLEVYHGNAFSEAKTCQYNIIWSFSLTN